MLSLARVIFYLAVGLFAEAVTAGETVYSNLNCAITMPAGWKRVPVDQAEYVAIARSPDELRSVVLRARSVTLGGRTAMNEQFKAEGRKAFLKDGTLKWEKEITVNGQPAWEIAGEGFFQGRKFSTVSRILIAGDKAYKVNTMSLGGDAGADPELQACLRSFRLLHAPPLPPKAGLGEMLLGLAIVGGGLWVVVGGGIWLIRKQQKKQAKSSG